MNPSVGLRALGAVLIQEESLVSAGVRIAQLLVDAIDGAQSAAISLVLDGRVETITATDPLLNDLDAWQSDLHSGPCLTAIEENHSFVIDDFAADLRWPRFSRKAAELSLRSMLCFPIAASPDKPGVLGLYSRSSGAFSENGRATGAEFAAQVNITLANVVAYEAALLKATQLEEGMHTRGQIGVAKGILMEREHCTEEEAFAILRRTSQHQNRKLREIAGRLVAQAQRSAGDTGGLRTHGAARNKAE